LDSRGGMPHFMLGLAEPDNQHSLVPAANILFLLWKRVAADRISIDD
jgi:hypothetical protein